MIRNTLRLHFGSLKFCLLGRFGIGAQAEAAENAFDQAVGPLRSCGLVEMADILFKRLPFGLPLFSYEALLVFLKISNILARGLESTLIALYGVSGLVYPALAVFDIVFALIDHRLNPR